MQACTATSDLTSPRSLPGASPGAGGGYKRASMNHIEAGGMQGSAPRPGFAAPRVPKLNLEGIHDNVPVQHMGSIWGSTPSRTRSQEMMHKLEDAVHDAEMQLEALEAFVADDMRNRSGGEAAVDGRKESQVLMKHLEELSAESMERWCRREEGAMDIFHHVLRMVDRAGPILKYCLSPPASPCSCDDDTVADDTSEGNETMCYTDRSVEFKDEQHVGAAVVQLQHPAIVEAVIAPSAHALDKGTAVLKIEETIRHVIWTGCFAVGAMATSRTFELTISGISESIGYVTNWLRAASWGASGHGQAVAPMAYRGGALMALLTAALTSPILSVRPRWLHPMWVFC